MSAKTENLDWSTVAFLFRWVERGLFDKQISAEEALAVIAHHPSAPWQSMRWDVDHKPYAKAFYDKFPGAKAPENAT